MRFNSMYIIRWDDKREPKNGTVYAVIAGPLPREQALEWMKQLNKATPSIYHWIQPVDWIHSPVAKPSRCWNS